MSFTPNKLTIVRDSNDNSRDGVYLDGKRLMSTFVSLEWDEGSPTGPIATIRLYVDLQVGVDLPDPNLVTADPEAE